MTTASTLRDLPTAALGLWAAAAGGGVRAALRWASTHTGLPVLIVAAIALVVSVRMLKRSVRFALEVALVAALLLAATRAGWIAW